MRTRWSGYPAKQEVPLRLLWLEWLRSETNDQVITAQIPGTIFVEFRLSPKMDDFTPCTSSGACTPFHQSPIDSFIKELTDVGNEL